MHRLGSTTCARSIKVAHRAVANHIAAAIQALADVHPGQDRRSTGRLVQATHRHVIPHTVLRGAIHRRLAPKGRLHERD